MFKAIAQMKPWFTYTQSFFKPDLKGRQAYFFDLMFVLFGIVIFKINKWR